MLLRDAKDPPPSTRGTPSTEHGQSSHSVTASGVDLLSQDASFYGPGMEPGRSPLRIVDDPDFPLFEYIRVSPEMEVELRNQQLRCQRAARQQQISQPSEAVVHAVPALATLGQGQDGGTHPFEDSHPIGVRLRPGAVRVEVGSVMAGRCAFPMHSLSETNISVTRSPVLL